jgi:hypothetical protein
VRGLDDCNGDAPDGGGEWWMDRCAVPTSKLSAQLVNVCIVASSTHTSVTRSITVAIFDSTRSRALPLSICNQRKSRIIGRKAG